MQKAIFLLLGVVAGAALSQGYLALSRDSSDPAYLVVSSRAIDPTGLGPYREAAGPVAQAAGIEIVARADSIEAADVLEGTWPHSGALVIERFDSMEALKTFWYSDAYQAAIPLREGKVDINFIVALPGS